MRYRELATLFVQVAPKCVSGWRVGQLGFSSPQRARLAEQVGGDARVTTLARSSGSFRQQREHVCINTVTEIQSITGPTPDERARRARICEDAPQP